MYVYVYVYNAYVFTYTIMYICIRMRIWLAKPGIYSACAEKERHTNLQTDNKEERKRRVRTGKGGGREVRKRSIYV